MANDEWEDRKTVLSIGVTYMLFPLHAAFFFLTNVIYNRMAWNKTTKVMKYVWQGTFKNLSPYIFKTDMIFLIYSPFKSRKMMQITPHNNIWYNFAWSLQSFKNIL